MKNVFIVLFCVYNTVYIQHAIELVMKYNTDNDVMLQNVYMYIVIGNRSTQSPRR